MCCTIATLYSKNGYSRLWTVGDMMGVRGGGLFRV
jgi:hypothetical protein